MSPRRKKQLFGWRNWKHIRKILTDVDGCSGGLSWLVRLTLRRPPKFEPA